MNLKIHILLITIASTITCSEDGIKLFFRNETNENFQACVPSEIIKIIFNFCDVIEQCRLRLANKALYNAIYFNIEKPLSLDLNKNNNQFEATTTNIVCSLLVSNKIIPTLNLNNNKIGVTGAQYISDALKINNTLKNLH